MFVPSRRNTALSAASAVTHCTFLNDLTKSDSMHGDHEAFFDEQYFGGDDLPTGIADTSLPGSASLLPGSIEASSKPLSIRQVAIAAVSKSSDSDHTLERQDSEDDLPTEKCQSAPALLAPGSTRTKRACFLEKITRYNRSRASSKLSPPSSGANASSKKIKFVMLERPDSHARSLPNPVMIPSKSEYRHTLERMDSQGEEIEWMCDSPRQMADANTVSSKSSDHSDHTLERLDSQGSLPNPASSNYTLERMDSQGDEIE